MGLTTMTELLKDAQRGDYAVGAFNMTGTEMVMGAMEAAEELCAPVILQAAQGRAQYVPIHLIMPMMVRAAEKATVQVAVQLDHARDMDLIREALDCGCTSVMFDGSSLAMRENIERTNEVKKLAEAYGASVEGEIGRIGGSEGEESAAQAQAATAEDAAVFCRETGVDALAVGVGNAHGFYRGTPRLRFDLISEIAGLISTPLVLHGGSGISDDDFRRCIRCGMRKINIGTSNFYMEAKCAKEALREMERPDYFAMNAAIVRGVRDNTKKHMETFGMKERDRK